MLDRYVYNATVYLYTTRQMPPMLDHHNVVRPSKRRSALDLYVGLALEDHAVRAADLMYAAQGQRPHDIHTPH